MARIQAELALNNCQACSDSSELLVAWLSQNAVFPVAGSCRSPLLSLVSGRAGTFFGWAPPRYGTRRGPSWPGCDGFEDCSCFSLHHQFALNLNLTLSNSARGTPDRKRTAIQIRDECSAGELRPAHAIQNRHVGFHLNVNRR